MPATLASSLKVIATEILAFIILLMFLSANTLELIVLIGFLCGLIFFVIRFRKEWLDGIYGVFRSAGPPVKYLPIVLALIVFPFIEKDNPYRIYLIIMFMINTVMVIGLDYMVGGANLTNFGYAGFYAIGAYTSAVLTTQFGLSFWLALPVSGFASLLLGFLLGLPVLKTRGYYLALITMAFGLIVVTVFENTMWLGGPNGISNIPNPGIGSFMFGKSISIGGIHLPFETNYFYLTSVILAIAMAFTFWLYNSQIGLVWNAVRDDEIASKCFGININYAKLLAFSMGSFWGGIAGSLYAHLVGFIAPADFTLMTSVMLLAMVIVGGMSNPWGGHAGGFPAYYNTGEIQDVFRFQAASVWFDYRVYGYLQAPGNTAQREKEL
jgi:branched-chain amino acid transport system permease protein